MSSKPTEIKVNQRQKIKEEDRIGIEEQFVLKCSNCDKKLASVIIIKEHSPSEIEQSYQCLCPFCGDKSFKKTVKGRSAANAYNESEYEISNVESETEMDEFFDWQTKKGVRINNLIELRKIK